VVRWHARWVVPVATPPIADGTVITDGDRITWVGPRANAPAGGRDEELGESILTPGLVNAHTHLDLTMMRGALEDVGFFDWVRTLTQIKREVLVDDDFRAAALLGAAEGLSRGITTFGDTADNDSAFDALLTLGARGIAYREVFGPDPAQLRESMDGLAAAVTSMRARATPLVRVGVSPHAAYSVSDELFKAVGEFAAREGLPLAVHVAESAVEDDLVIRAAGPFAEFLRGRGIPVTRRAYGPIQLVDAAGLLRTGTLLIHCVRASASDVARLADTGCGIAHCPASNAKLGHGIAPLKEFLAAGARVGLGSDSMASNNTMDLLGEARLASLQQRALTKKPDALPARAAFRLATLGGAEALRLDEETGSLVPGKQADLAAFRVQDLGAPAEDPLAALVFGAGQVVAHRVVVAGRELVRGGVVTGLDPAAQARVRDAGMRVAQWRRARASR
jgi:5-methylthioadenosine/S-adenosylhomocysteine deaminase